MSEIYTCVDCANMLGENPLWDVDAQRLYWLDGMSREIWRCATDGSDVVSWTLPEEIGAIGFLALRRRGGAVLGCETGIYFFDFHSGKTEFIAHPVAGAENLRINDGKVDSRGRLVFGSMDLDTFFAEDPATLPQGALYLLDTERTVRQIGDDIGIFNGPCWAPDQKTFYFVDSWKDVIYAYDWLDTEGALGDRRVFASFPHRSLPDGGTVDEEGFIWNASNGAFSGDGGLIRFAPDGSIDRKIRMPVDKVTSLTFGGPDLDVIFVTSNRLEGGDNEHPLDGRLFAIRGLGIRGVPERRFAG